MQPSPQDPTPVTSGGAGPEGSQEFDLGPLAYTHVVLLEGDRKSWIGIQGSANMSELGVRRKSPCSFVQTSPTGQIHQAPRKKASCAKLYVPASCMSSRGGAAQILVWASFLSGDIAWPAGAVVRQHRGKCPRSPSSEVQKAWVAP